jgi:hypothetical protein
MQGVFEMFLVLPISKLKKEVHINICKQNVFEVQPNNGVIGVL